MAINPKYQGNISIAITTFREDYNIKVGMNERKLKKSLNDDTHVLGSEYKILAIYNKVCSACHGPIDEAINKLKSGEQVNLDAILE